MTYRSTDYKSHSESLMKLFTSRSFLLKPSKTTNFQFEIVGNKLANDQIEVINNISGRSKIKKRVDAIKKASCLLNFVKIENRMFANNLVLIDSTLPQILATMVIQFYSGSLSKTSELLALLERDNILDFDTTDDHPYYAYKLKRLYTDIALGMMPAKMWGGNYDATGGYLIVKDDGDVICYHIYNKTQFENYLIKNTKFETASSSRHNFGKIYSEDGKLYMNLNLQIRFIK